MRALRGAAETAPAKNSATRNGRSDIDIQYSGANRRSVCVVCLLAAVGQSDRRRKTIVPTLLYFLVVGSVFLVASGFGGVSFVIWDGVRNSALVFLLSSAIIP